MFIISYPCNVLHAVSNAQETHPRFRQAFNKTMVLFDQVVEIFDLPQFDCFWKDSGGFQISDGFGVGSILVQRPTHAEQSERWIGHLAPRSHLLEVLNQPWRGAP